MSSAQFCLAHPSSVQFSDGYFVGMAISLDHPFFLSFEKVASIKFIREVEISDDGVFTVLLVSVCGGVFVLLLAIVVLGG